MGRHRVPVAPKRVPPLSRMHRHCCVGSTRGAHSRHGAEEGSPTTRRYSSCALSTLSCPALCSRAQVIYTNVGPGNSFNSGAAYLVGGPSSPYVYQEIAKSLSTGASAYDHIVFEGAFQYYLGANGLVVDLTSDAAGVPGTVLATSPVLMPVGVPGSLLTWTLNPSVTLSGRWGGPSMVSEAVAVAWLTKIAVVRPGSPTVVQTRRCAFPVQR